MTPVCGDGWDLPEVGVATLGLLERLGRSVEYPLERERSISFGSRGDPCCSRKCLPLKMIPASRFVVRT